MAQARFREIDDDFERVRKRNRRGYEPPWFSPLLKRSSVRAIAVETERLSEYLWFYEWASKASHTASHTHHIHFSKGQVILKPIRWLNEISTLLRFAVEVALHTYISIIKQYRGGELRDFVKKYRSDWQEPFMRMPSVDYKFN